MTHARKAVFAMAALVAAAACGTTVPHSGELAAGQGGSTGGPGGTTGLGGTATSGTISGPSTTGGGGSGSSGQLSNVGTSGTDGSSSGGTTGVLGSSSTSGGSSGTSGTGSQAVGVTPTTITVGIVYSVNSQTAAKAIGSNLNTGDPLAEQKVVIQDINDHGGIGGKKLLYVAHPIDATSTAPYSAQASEECNDLTQDHHVFAILDDLFGEDIRACAKKAGAVQVGDSAQAFSTAQTFQTYPYLLLPGSVRQDRIAAEWTPALKAQGYFGPWDFNTGKAGGALPVKVGILTFDDAASKGAVTTVLGPALQAAGYAWEAVYIGYPQGTADNGSTVSAIQSAVLRFRQDNVTHFLPLDAAAGLSLYFGKNASSQHYYPRYGLNTGDGVQTLVDTGLMPKDELGGALGYGWEPVLDVDASHDTDSGPYSNAARRHCIAIMKKGNVNIAGAPATRGALEYCDQFAFFKAAVEAGGQQVTRDSFLTGANSLRGSFLAGTTFSTYLDPAHHDGVASYRLFGFDGTCGCFLYTSPARRLP